jgi:Flp pilus assembly protein TadG
LEVISKLKDTKGSLQIGAVAVLLLFFMMLSAVMESMKLKSITQGVGDIVQQAVLSAAADNAYNAYNGVREGNTAAADYTDNWYDNVTTADVQYKLNSLLNLANNGGKYIKTSPDGKTQFALYNLNVQYDNPPVASFSNDTRLSFVTTFVLEVPMSFAGGYLMPYKKEMTVRSEYIPLY